MRFSQRCAIGLLLLCVGCSAQTQVPADLSHRIEQRLRAHYELPDEVSVQLGARTPSEFPDYDSLTVMLTDSSHKQQLNLLISKDNKTLVRYTKLDLTKDPYVEAMSKIDLSNRPWRGKSDAKVVVVNYDDFECPFCARMHQTLFGEIYRAYSDRIKIVYKDYPLDSVHPWANRAAVDSNCLAAQNNDSYWAFADAMHNNGNQIIGGRKGLPEQLQAVDTAARDQGTKFHLDMGKLDACLKAQDETAVKASVDEAEKVGVEATPTLFVNGRKINGAQSVEQMRAVIDRALREAAPPAATVPGPAK